MSDAHSTDRSAVEAYRSGAILNSPRLKLVQMVYAGAVREIKRAISEHGQSNRAAFGMALGRAQSLVGELMSSLDHDVEGGEISKSLEGLYEFCLWNFTQANLHYSVPPLEAALDVITRLQEAWDAIEDSEEDGQA